MEIISTHLSILWLCNKFMCSIFSKDTQPFDFIKCQKLAHKVKYISYINGALIMLFGNSRVRFFLN